MHSKHQSKGFTVITCIFQYEGQRLLLSIKTYCQDKVYKLSYKIQEENSFPPKWRRGKKQSPWSEYLWVENGAGIYSMNSNFMKAP